MVFRLLGRSEPRPDRRQSGQIHESLAQPLRFARTLLSRATQPIESGLLTVGSDEYKKHKRHQDQANRQLNLLRNDIGSAGGTERSEFYPYRYFASEGFLPGYNFTRLPLRVFVPAGDSTGEFISRPR